MGLDPQTRSSIWEYIDDLKQREDITIFLTTHYMDEAENCDRIAVIDHGQIVRSTHRRTSRPASARTFIYPGVLSMSVLFTAIFSAASIVWDREFGFLREMLVAPVSRSAIVIGKCLGGATVSTFQGIVILALAGLAHVPYDPILILTVIGELLLLSFTLTAFGVMMAARITQIQAFMALTQMLVMPLFFLSGALYPLRALPAWLTVLTRFDPITYVVYPMRHAVFSHLNVSPAASAALSPAVTWNGWAVPVGASLGIVAVMGAALLGMAIAEFQRTE